MSKMDSVNPRTPAQLERQYNFGKFGKGFNEILGIAKDAQTHAVNAEEAVKRLEEQGLDIDVVEALNVSAGTIELKSQGLSIISENFSLSAEDGIKTTRGVIGLWDISEKGISKITGNKLVKLTAPTATDEDVFTVATIENNAVTGVPLSIKANGNIFSYGVFESSNQNRTRYTTIDKGLITISGEWTATADVQVEMILMKFQALDDRMCELYAYGHWDDTATYINWLGLSVRVAE